MRPNRAAAGAAVCAVNVGIEQKGAGIGVVAQGGEDVGGLAHAYGFEIGAGELAAEVGRFVAVELQDVQRHLGEDFADVCGGFIDEQPDCAAKRGQGADNGLGLGWLDAAFAAGVEHQPDGIDAELGGGGGILGAGDAADFGADGGHVCLCFGYLEAA